MKYIALIIFLFQFSCNQNIETINISNNKVNDSINYVNDTFEIKKLIKELYTWRQNDLTEDFKPALRENDTIYFGIDLEYHGRRISELKSKNYFSNEFINNYNDLRNYLNDELRTNIAWYVGELPPFGNGANPWCNCQDYPEDFVNNIEFKNLVIENNNAKLTWKFKDDISYNVKLKKINNQWKIDYLEGFDLKNYKVNL